MQHRKFIVGTRVKVTIPGRIFPNRVYIGLIVNYEADGRFLKRKEPRYIIIVDGRKILRRVRQSWIEPI